MLVLGLDTTTRLGSVALARDGTPVGSFVGDASTAHARRLPGDILALLALHGLRVSDVDVFAVAAGPGSFTGLRIGVATIQGLAFATGRPVIGVSALEALAHSTWQEGTANGVSSVAVWMDAHREEVFSAIYERDDTAPAGLRLQEGPTVEAPRTAAERWRQRPQADVLPVVGDGAVRYRGVLEEVMGAAMRLIEPSPIAASIAVLGWRRARAGEAGLPHAVRPLYVRRPDAELARDRAEPPRR